MLSRYVETAESLLSLCQDAKMSNWDTQKVIYTPPDRYPVLCTVANDGEPIPGEMQSTSTIFFFFIFCFWQCGRNTNHAFFYKKK